MKRVAPRASKSRSIKHLSKELHLYSIHKQLRQLATDRSIPMSARLCIGIASTYVYDARKALLPTLSCCQHQKRGRKDDRQPTLDTLGVLPRL